MIRYIYTFFVGLFISIFIGLGIAVFYEAPKAPEAPAWYNSMSVKQELNAAERQEEQAYQAKQSNYLDLLHVYNRNVSIIVLIIAVLLMTVALLYAKYLSVVADGLLLGSIFTLLYGIGIGMATDNNVFRFIVAGVGLAVTLTLGYLKFAHTHGKSHVGNI